MKQYPGHYPQALQLPVTSELELLSALFVESMMSCEIVANKQRVKIIFQQYQLQNMQPNDTIAFLPEVWLDWMWEEGPVGQWAEGLDWGWAIMENMEKYIC